MDAMKRMYMESKSPEIEHQNTSMPIDPTKCERHIKTSTLPSIKHSNRLGWILSTSKSINRASSSSQSIMTISFATSRAMNLSLLPDTIQRDHHATETTEKRQPIRSLITLQSLSTISLPLRPDDTVVIENRAIKQIKHVSAEYRRKANYAPVLAQAGNAECVRYYGREDAEKEAVGQTCK